MSSESDWQTVTRGKPSVRHQTTPNPPPPDSSSHGIPTETSTTATKKKRKKKTGTKEERLRKREEKKFNELYAPKDSRVSVISPAILQQYKELSLGQPSKSNRPASNFPLASGSGIPTPGILKPKQTPFLSDFEFPSLGKPVARPNLPSAAPARKNVEIVTPIAQSSGPSELTPDSAASFNFTDDSTPLTSKPPSGASVSKRRAKKPLVIGIADLLKPRKELEEILTPKDRSKKGISATKSKQSDKGFQRIGNSLDASAPIVIHRGKIRKPKVKKPSPLKRAILTSRALRRRITIGSHFGPGQNIIEELVPTSADSPNIEGIGVSSSPQIKLEISATIPDTLDMKSIGASLVEIDSKHDVSSIVIKTEESELNAVEDPLVSFFQKLVQDTTVEAEKKSALEAIPVEYIAQAKTQIHSRKFRTYCDMFVNKEFHGHVIALLKFLHRLQDKLYHTDPIKYKTKKRYVIGLKNIQSYNKINKVRLVIIAPDIEQNDVQGGLDEKVEDLIRNAKEKNIPYVFSGLRYILGYPIFIKTPVAAIGILDYEGGEVLVRKVLEEAEILREKYMADLDQIVQNLMDVNKEKSSIDCCEKN